MALCTVTGAVYFPSGELARSVTIKFSRVDKSVNAEYLGAVVPDDVYTKTDRLGQVDFEILTGRYIMAVGDYSGGAQVPDATTANISDILTIITPTIPVPAWLTEALAARDAAAASADAAEGSAIIAAAAANPFSSYSAALTAEKTGLDKVSAIIGGNLVEWVRQPGGALLGGGWVPAGTATLYHFGALAGGDVSSAVLAAEAYGSPVDLLGRDFTASSVSPLSLTTPFVNGVLTGLNQDGFLEQYRPPALTQEYQIERRSTKARYTNWSGSDVLWLGTSIPQQGIGGTSYPELACAAVGAKVTNMAWSGSGAGFNPLSTIDPTGSINQVKSLSMTNADVAAGFALYGTGSVFDPNYDVVTKANQMTAEFRIGAAFAAGSIDVVVLDHNHNDRRRALGTATPPSSPIASVAFGETTAITVSNGAMFAVGNGVGVVSQGVGRFAYAAGRVQAVSGNVVTIAYDTSELTGTVTGGSLFLLDRATFFGAWEFLIYYIRGRAAFHGYNQPLIILCSAPSEYTNGARTNDIWASGEKILAVSNKWDLPFFDVSTEFQVGANDHLSYFGDLVHPVDLGARQALANLWVAWMEGGHSRRLTQADYLPSGGSEFQDQTEAIYSALSGGFIPATNPLGTYATVLDEKFTSGLTGYTIVGTTPAPAISAAPWGGGDSALTSVVTPTQVDAYIRRSMALTSANRVSFDLWLPEVSNLTTGTAKSINLVRVRTATGNHVQLRLVIRATSTRLQVIYFTSPNVGLVQPEAASVNLVANTKHRIVLEHVRDDGNGTGGIRVLQDGQVILSGIRPLDASHGADTALDIGASGSNLAGNLTIYMGNVLVESRGRKLLPGVFANDTAAATGGIAVGDIYRASGGAVVWRQV